MSNIRSFCYNTEETPDHTDWSSKEDTPFLNSSDYVDSNLLPEPIQNSDNVALEWIMSGTQLQEVSVVIRGKIIAKMQPGPKPGWSLAVKKNGPLARRLTIESA